MIRNVLIASAAVLSAASGNAVTFATSPFDPPPAGQHIIDNFNTVTPPVGITYSGDYQIDPNNDAGLRAPPAGDTTAYFATPSNTGTLPGTATIDLSGFVSAHGNFKSLSFYWGSIDTYNTLTLLGTGLTGQTVFTGDQVAPPADGNQGSAATNRTVSFTFASNERLTGLQLSSSQRAFEIDDIAADVPEPATWVMLVAGFGMVGTAARARKRTTAA